METEKPCEPVLNNRPGTVPFMDCSELNVSAQTLLSGKTAGMMMTVAILALSERLQSPQNKNREVNYRKP